MEGQEQSINSTAFNAQRRRGPLSPTEHARKQQQFLKSYRDIGIIKAACKAAGIDRSTYKYWRDNDPEFVKQLPDARDEANETLEIAAYAQAVLGIESYVVSNGRIVYHETPVLNEDGTPQFNERGQQVVLRGKPIMERKYAPSILITLLKANMPEKYKERMEHSGKVDATIEHTGLVIDTRTLSPERLAQLKEIAQEMKGKEQ